MDCREREKKKMRYLLMGCGAIGKSLLAIIKNLQEDYDITVCDPKINGLTGQEMIRKQHQDFDVVINLTQEKTIPIMDLCDTYGLAYIDAGFECDESGFSKPSVCYEAFAKVVNSSIKGRQLLGFGMNPGIIEYMVKVYAPDRPYLAVTFETDTPIPPAGSEGQVFATWCPTTYYAEAAECPANVVGKEGTFIHVSDAKRRDYRLTTKIGTYFYDVTPHDELYSIVKFNELCQGSAFIFHAPDNLQEFAHENPVPASEIWKRVSEIPVYDDLEGEEHVGVIFYDGTDNLSYVVNRVKHADCYKKVGRNATSWQTACGVYIAMQLIADIPEGTKLTFSQATDLYKDKIREILRKLDFKIERINYFMDKEEFDQKLLPLFKL